MEYKDDGSYVCQHDGIECEGDCNCDCDECFNEGLDYDNCDHGEEECEVECDCECNACA